MAVVVDKDEEKKSRRRQPGRSSRCWMIRPLLIVDDRYRYGYSCLPSRRHSIWLLINRSGCAAGCLCIMLVVPCISYKFFLFLFKFT